MDIKEIALKVARNMAWALEVPSLRVKAETIEHFAEALIESYKAELLKKVGEPVLYAEFAEDGGWLGDASEYADHLEEPHALYTSDQVAAAILKATKPLEERRCEVCGYAEHHREHTGCLRKQIEKLTAERDAALARLSEERDIWDRMLGDAADKFAHLEREIDDCLYVLDALWDKQCDKIVTQKWAEILTRNKRVTGASSAEDSSEPTSSE